MASIKNFGLQGIASDVQFGKSGNRVVSSLGLFRVVDTQNNAVRLQVANATSETDAVALGQLDKVVADLTANAAQQSLDIANAVAAADANAAAQAALISDLTANSVAQEAAIAAAIAAAEANAVAQQTAIDDLTASTTANAVAQQAALDALDANVTTAQADIVALYANAVAQEAAIAAALENTGSDLTALQTEVDAIETAVGLAADGSFVAPTGTNYIDNATSVLGAVTLVDTAVKAAVTASEANAVAQQVMIDANVTAINGEIARATAAESAIANTVNAEVTRATLAETALQTAIDGEVIRAQGVENTLQTAINDEITRATARENEIADLLANTVTDYKAADAAIISDVAALSDRVTALGSVFNYAGALDGSELDLDTLPSTGQDVGDYYKVTGDGPLTFVYNEGADSIVVNKGDGLVKTPTGWDKIDNTNSAVFGTVNLIDVTGSADTGYTVTIAEDFVSRLADVEDRTSVDTSALQGQIDDLRANAITEAARQDGVNAAQNEMISQEANARTAADALNSQAISDENARAIAAEAVLTNDLANAVTAYAAADAKLTSDLANAVTDYQAADLVLQGNIDAEKTRAEAAEAALQANVANVASDIANAVTAYGAADAAINANVANVANTVSALQAEVDATQAGAGLATDGSYVANATANFIADATSLKDADDKLDAAVKSLTEGLSNLSQDQIQSANTLYSVKTSDTAVELYGDKGGVKTLFANAVTGAAQDSTITLSTAVAGEVRFEAHSDTASNVDIRLVPQGDGQVVVGEEGTNGVIQADDGYDLTLAGGDATGATVPGKLILKGGHNADSSATAAIVLGDTALSALEVQTSATGISVAATGAATDLDVVLSPKGAGVVDASNHKIAHVADATEDHEAVNLGQLSDAVSAAQGAATLGSVRTVTASIGSADGAINLSGLVKGTVLRVKVMVLAAYGAGATLTVGRASAATELATANDIDEATVGIYVVESIMDYASATQLVVTLSGATGVGSAKVVVEYLSA